MPNDLKDFKKIEYYDNEGNIFKIKYNRSKNYIDFKDINPFLIDALILLEDKSFYTHYGTDNKRIIKVFFTNFFKKNIQGASTISQQLSRTLFLNNNKNIIRKIKEYFYTTQIEKYYSKEKILESYINNIYLGYNIYGFMDASNFYFNKELNNLNKYEIILLINLIKNPVKFNFLKDFDYSSKGVEKSLKKLVKVGFLTKFEANDIINQSTNINTYNNIGNNLNLDDFYIDLINKNSKINGYFPIKIYSYFNQNINKKMSDLLYKYNDIKPEISVVLFEPYSFNLIYMIGSKNYNKSSYNRAFNSKRQIGSTVKPFLYYSALKNGFRPDTNLLSKQILFKDENNNFYMPKNYSNRYDKDPITLAYALATSDNIYAVKTLQKIGFSKFKKELKNVGLNFKDINLTSSLGSNSETLYNITKSYNILASLGIVNDINLIDKIVKNNKKVYKNNTAFKDNKTRVLNKNISYILTDLLTLTFDNKVNQINTVTGSSISDKLKTKFSAKSGLTDFDSYFIGYNQEICIGVWVGNDDNSILDDEFLSIPKNIFLEISNEFINNKWYSIPDDIKFRDIKITDNYNKKVPFLK